MEASEDGRTWTIKLHDNVTFSDGTPFDANTAVEFINWFNSTNLKYWFYTSLYMQEVKAVDDHTLQFTTEYPIRTVEDYDGVWWWMLPPHIWGEFDDTSMVAYSGFPPVGTGPYTVAEHKPGEYIIFDARPDYYGGKPPVDRIVYQLYANADAMINALLAGEIDLTTHRTPTVYYDQLVTAPNTTVEERPPGDVHHLAFNLASGGKKHEAVEDPKVREAIDYSIDKEQIVAVALLGHGTTCANTWACGANYVGEIDPSLKPTPYDPEKAKQILTDAGYIDSDQDGIRETSDGKPLEFRLFYKVEVPAHLTMANMVKDWLAQVGIKLNPEGMENATLQRTVYDDRDYDIALFSEGPDIDPASIDYEYSCWTSQAGSGALNNSGYCNEELDSLLFQYWTTADEETAREPFRAIEAILMKERPRITLAGENRIQAFHNDRFDFVRNSCNVGMGMWDFPSVMQIVVK